MVWPSLRLCVRSRCLVRSTETTEMGRPTTRPHGTMMARNPCHHDGCIIRVRVIGREPNASGQFPEFPEISAGFRKPERFPAGFRRFPAGFRQVSGGFRPVSADYISGRFPGAPAPCSSQSTGLEAGGRRSDRYWKSLSRQTPSRNKGWFFLSRHAPLFDHVPPALHREAPGNRNSSEQDLLRKARCHGQ
jgi:hypothetical protein